MSADRWPEPCAQCGGFLGSQYGSSFGFCRCIECGKKLHGIGTCFENHKCVDDEPEETEAAKWK